MTQLLNKDVPFKWTDRQQTAFYMLKDELCKELLLQRPASDKPFILTTDASGFAIGPILSQGEIREDKPIAYASRSLNTHEVKYYTHNKGALAIVYFVTYFRHYLYGRKFKIVTDHKPLIWFQNSKDPCSRVTRWKLKLSEYDFESAYKAGKMNNNADALSRNPVDSEERIDGRSVNRAIPISNSRNNENSNRIFWKHKFRR